MDLITVATEVMKMNNADPMKVRIFYFLKFITTDLTISLFNFYKIVADEAESNQFWLTHTPNYFFPKMDHYPDLKTATLVFLASAMSLVMLIFLLIIILYRMNHHAREQRELQSQLRTISELLGKNKNSEVL